MPFILFIFMFVGGAIGLLFSFIGFFDGLYHKKSSQSLNCLTYFILIAVAVTGCAFWMYYSNNDREVEEEKFCKVFVDDTVSDRQVQCVRIKDVICNINKELGCIVGESSIIRVYKLDTWKYGIWWGVEMYEYEIISPSHKRYAEAKNMIMDRK